MLVSTSNFVDCSLKLLSHTSDGVLLDQKCLRHAAPLYPNVNVIIFYLEMSVFVEGGKS